VHQTSHKAAIGPRFQGSHIYWSQ